MYFSNSSLYNSIESSTEFKVLNGLNCPNILLKIEPSNCTILNSWVFENFASADEPITKALQNLETCVKVNNELSGKLSPLLQSPIAFAKRFKLTSAPFFIPNFN